MSNNEQVLREAASANLADLDRGVDPEVHEALGYGSEEEVIRFLIGGTAKHIYPAMGVSSLTTTSASTDVKAAKMTSDDRSPSPAEEARINSYSGQFPYATAYSMVMGDKPASEHLAS